MGRPACRTAWPGERAMPLGPRAAPGPRRRRAGEHGSRGHTRCSVARLRASRGSRSSSSLHWSRSPRGFDWHMASSQRRTSVCRSACAHSSRRRRLTFRVQGLASPSGSRVPKLLTRERRETPARRPAVPCGSARSFGDAIRAFGNRGTSDHMTFTAKKNGVCAAPNVPRSGATGTRRTRVSEMRSVIVRMAKRYSDARVSQGTRTHLSTERRVSRRWPRPRG